MVEVAISFLLLMKVYTYLVRKVLYDKSVSIKLDITLNKIVLKHPTKVLKGTDGENSHVHRLVGEPGSDFVLPVPVGVTVYTQTGVKIGIVARSIYLLT